MAALVVTSALVASGEEESAQIVSTSGEAAAAEATPAEQAAAGNADSTGGGEAANGSVRQAKVGDVVKLGDWRIQVHQVTDPVKPDNDFLTPNAGNRWVGVNSTVYNDSSSPQTVSSLMCFDLRDKSGRRFDPALGAGGTQMDGEVPVGGRLKGDVTFEVPAAAEGFALHFKCDFLSSGSAVIDLGR